MNLLTHTTDHLTEAVKHYLCLRMKFRGSILKEAEQAHQVVACAHVQKQLKH